MEKQGAGRMTDWSTSSCGGHLLLVQVPVQEETQQYLFNHREECRCHLLVKSLYIVDSQSVNLKSFPTTIVACYSHFFLLLRIENDHL